MEVVGIKIDHEQTSVDIKKEIKCCGNLWK